MRSPDNLVMDTDARIAQLQSELAEVEAKRKALREFMTEARSQKGDLFSWIAYRELNHDLPGADMVLTIGFDGEVSFRD